jgi:CRP-like cAMP-binding protein
MHAVSPLRESFSASCPPTATKPTPRPNVLLLAEDKGLCRHQFGLFSGLTESDQAHVLSQGTRKAYAPGDVLFSQGEKHEGVFVIESGRVKVFYNSPSGREITLAYWGPGHFVGGPVIFGATPHQWSGVVEVGGSMVFLAGGVLQNLIHHMPRLALGVIEGLSFKGRCYSTMAQMLGTRSAAERLTHLLKHLCEAFGVVEPDGILIADAFTHAQLANMIGSTRQWVTISLKKLHQARIIHCENATIKVLRRDLL